MHKFIFLTLLTAIQLAFALPQIENAKIGSTIIKDYSSSWITPMVGHAGVVVSEYTHNDDWDFIAESASNAWGLETTTSYNYFLNDNTYLGHYRAVNRNYTKRERELIKKAAMQAIHTHAGYEYINLYTYDWDFSYDNNTPYNINVVPTDFRCDGLAEWATEVALNPTNPSQSDGFYKNNSFINIPIGIQYSPADIIGTPEKPILSLNGNEVEIKFPKVSGAWSKALYAVYKSDSHILNMFDKPNLLGASYETFSTYLGTSKYSFYSVCYQ